MADMQSEAHVETPTPRRYIKRLCKHFAHKVEATYTEKHGRAEFPFGSCEMTAEPGVLILHAEAGDEAALERVQDVTARHLEAFAEGRESLAVTWEAVSTSSVPQR